MTDLFDIQIRADYAAKQARRDKQKELLNQTSLSPEQRLLIEDAISIECASALDFGNSLNADDHFRGSSHEPIAEAIIEALRANPNLHHSKIAAHAFNHLPPDSNISDSAVRKRLKDDRFLAYIYGRYIELLDPESQERFVRERLNFVLGVDWEVKNLSSVHRFKTSNVKSNPDRKIIEINFPTFDTSEAPENTDIF